MVQRILLVLLSLAALIASGCASGMLHREGLEATGNIAVVSVVAQRVPEGKREANDQVLQASVEHAAVTVRSGLAEVRKWKVLDGLERKEARRELSSFGSPNLAELAALFPQPPDQEHAREVAAAELAAWKEQFIGLKGLPVIPREALLPDEERTQKDAAVRPLMLQQAGKLCKGLQVDAVAFVQARYAITHPRESAFIVTDDRTDGLLTVAVTLTIVDQQGAIIADMGLRPLNERSRSRDLLPVYRGTGRDAVRPENIDLADPKKKVARAFAALLDESVGDLMAELKTALGN